MSGSITCTLQETTPASYPWQALKGLTVKLFYSTKNWIIWKRTKHRNIRNCQNKKSVIITTTVLHITFKLKVNRCKTSWKTGKKEQHITKWQFRANIGLRNETKKINFTVKFFCQLLTSIVIGKFNVIKLQKYASCVLKLSMQQSTVLFTMDEESRGIILPRNQKYNPRLFTKPGNLSRFDSFMIF